MAPAATSTSLSPTPAPSASSAPPRPSPPSRSGCSPPLTLTSDDGSTPTWPPAPTPSAQTAAYRSRAPVGFPFRLRSKFGNELHLDSPVVREHHPHCGPRVCFALPSDCIQ